MKLEEEQLLKSWEIKNLGEVCIYSKGKMPKVLTEEKNEKCSVPYINIKAFEKGIFSEYTNGEKCNLCDDDDLLMVWDGARCGLIGKAKKGAVGSTLMKILPRETIHKGYLYYFISSKFRSLNTKPRGVGIPHIEPSLLWNFELFLPPLAEQQKIVTKIEELFSQLENGKQQLLTAQKQLKTYRQSLLKSAFEGRLTNQNLKAGELPKGWEVKNLGKVCDKISLNGIKIKQKDYLQNGKFPVVDQGQEVIGGYFNDEKFLVPNDPPYIIFGDHTKVKKFINFRFVAGADGVKVIKPHSIIDPKFFFYLIHTVKIPDKGYARHFQFLEKEDICFPKNILEQQKIVAILESKLTICDKIEETIKISLQQSETLRQSILKKAFEGRLV